MANLITINKAVKNFKILIDKSIKMGGNKGKTAMIRSSKPILNIHEAVKIQLIQNGVNKKLIYPPLKSRTPELKLAGFLKQKNQDVCVTPNDIEAKVEILKIRLLNGEEDEFGEEFTKKTLTINIRSQISSIQKNFDTLYERTISEAQNLHERCPEMVLGEVYMIAVPEYDDTEFANKKSKFKSISPKLVEKYIKSFQAITNRNNISKNFYQYEATCLLIVDFSKKMPKIYNSTAELIADELLPSDTAIKFEGLEWSKFSEKLIKTYETRFGTGILS
ncbi:MAG: restriction endonuclease [Bacteroidota bacterium]|nr:restriction endonuclease [Bacteroidota bacterium]